MDKSYKVISFYCFIQIKEEFLLKFKTKLLQFEKKGLSGLVVLAEEGINGTVCGSKEIINKIFSEINEFVRNKDLNEKISFTNKKIFKKLKVKIKKEIVTMGLNDLLPEINSGIYVDHVKWNSLIEDEETLIIDTRNFYEVSLGTFKKAVNPETNNFREFPKWLDENLSKLTNNNIDKKIAMFCTGGIRCEKATTFLKKKGYNNVFHLKGGILKYLDEVPNKENKYKGECYVFDERVTVDNNLNKGSYSICHACGMPLSIEDKQNTLFVEGIQCHFCIDKFSDKDRMRFAERQKQIVAEIKKKKFSIRN